LPTGARRLLFVSNTQDNTISRFLLDGKGGIQSAGAATHLANPDAQPCDIEVSPDGRFLFVGTVPNAVEVFSIDKNSGNLQPVQNSPFTVATKTYALAVTHSGQNLYAVGDDSDVIYGFTIDGTTGKLTQLTTDPVHTRFALTGVAIDASDKFLFASTAIGEKLLIYNILPSGALQEAVSSGLRSGYLTGDPIVAPNGRFVYISDPFFDNGILAYTLDAISGMVAAVPGSPFFDGQAPYSVAVSPHSSVLVVSRGNPGHVASYRINPQTGALSAISGNLSDSGLAVGKDPNHVLLVPIG